MNLSATPVGSGLPQIPYFSRISRLETLKFGFGAYYLELLNDKDEVLSVGAACALLDTGFAPSSIWPRIVALCEFEVVKTRAFSFFMEKAEYDRASEVRKRPTRTATDLVQRAMDAEFEHDYAELARIGVEKFLQYGSRDDLTAAADAAENQGGWKKALPIWERLVLINPQEARWAVQLCLSLQQANQFDVLGMFCGLCESIGIFPTVTAIFRSVIALNEGHYAEGLKRLDGLGAAKLPAQIETIVCKTKAALFDAAGRYEEANRWYIKQNRAGASDGFNPKGFYDQISRNARLKLDPLHEDEHDNYHIMLGFPRSGTTLLENVLSSHPRIETFEEIPAFARVNEYVAALPDSASALTAEQALAVRSKYYAEIDHWKKKAGASVFIDKLPILSGQANFLKLLFPEKRYIFSIRHPYDVVLSCYKQNFSSNVAMDNFTNIEDSCRVYDFVMKKWFSTFDMDSEQVCYVRYDRLVEDFKAEVTKTLRFLGFDWDDSVLQFSKHAETRKTKTPSYAKVRSGLSIGVQSSWRNYEFLFRKPEARLLTPWLERFGYEGL